MKILFVSEYYAPKIMGGGEINLEIIAKALAKEGHDISVFFCFLCYLLSNNYAVLNFR
jgi:hypothetical protein